MTELVQQDLYWIMRRLPKRVVSLMKDYPSVFLAGGFIRACVANEDPQDIDLFAPDEERAGLFANVLAQSDGKLFKTENAYTIRIPDTVPIQVIHRWTYTKPEELIESFDFTIAKAVVCRGEYRNSTTHKPAWKSLIHDNFYADLAAKRLVYTKPHRNEDAGGSMLRVLKFYHRGYKIPLDSLGAVMARLMSGVKEDRLPLRKADDFEDALGLVLTGLLREVDPLLDPLHIFHLPTAAESQDSDHSL